MKRSHLFGRSLAIAPLALGLVLGSTGVATAAATATAPTAATPTMATPATSAPARTVHGAAPAHHAIARHGKARKAVKRHPRKVVRATHATAPASSAAGARPVANQAVALTPFEARMVVLVNQARAAAGLPALTVVAGATDVARRWSLKLAGDDVLSHNPLISQDLQAAGSPNWTFIAENVGSAPANDADGMFAAYMSSPHHRDNILDPRAIEIGMGAVTTPEVEGDTTYNTMDFVNSYSAAYGQTRTNPVAAELPLAGLASALS